MISVDVSFNAGDRDCSRLQQTCYVVVDVLPRGIHMWTGNEREILAAHGFVRRSLSSPKRGDILWREGHTEMYLGNGMCGGARIDERGTIYGSTQGDQTGREIARSAYDPDEWEELWRYEGGGTFHGIPKPEAAAQVCEHFIDHDAHGYSQPNRDGDGTVETITIIYDPDADVEAFDVTMTVTFRKATFVRTRPSADDDAKTETRYKVGATCTIDGIVLADGRVWGTYIGSTSGKRRYVCIGTTERVE